VQSSQPPATLRPPAGPGGPITLPDPALADASTALDGVASARQARRAGAEGGKPGWTGLALDDAALSKEAAGASAAALAAMEQWDASAEGGESAQPRQRCRLCGAAGHNRLRCPVKPEEAAAERAKRAESRAARRALGLETRRAPRGGGGSGKSSRFRGVSLVTGDEAAPAAARQAGGVGDGSGAAATGARAPAAATPPTPTAAAAAAASTAPPARTWRAQVWDAQADRVRYLGRFDDEEAAARAHDAALLALRGSSPATAALLNFPPPPTALAAPLPMNGDCMAAAAADAILRAWEGGATRLRVDFLLPGEEEAACAGDALLAPTAWRAGGGGGGEAGAAASASASASASAPAATAAATDLALKPFTPRAVADPGALAGLSVTGENTATSRFATARALAEATLRAVKAHPRLRGRLGMAWIAREDLACEWVGDRLAAALFPTPEALPRLRELAAADPARPLIVFNPAWGEPAAPGAGRANVVSDFGLGRGAREAEAWAAGFAPAAVLARVRARGRELRIFHAAGGPWQTHAVWPNGRGASLVAVDAARPTYARLSALAAGLPGAGGRDWRSWGAFLGGGGGGVEGGHEGGRPPPRPAAAPPGRRPTPFAGAGVSAPSTTAPSSTDDDDDPTGAWRSSARDVRMDPVLTVARWLVGRSGEGEGGGRAAKAPAPPTPPASSGAPPPRPWE